MEQKPILSIAIIFKNEIRCLERCLTSLRPLQQAIPCQVVMADTGSTDGSRAVAERYADILIDFPWRDDFAAARNAVLDRCSGSWCLTVDADEWLEEDVSELVSYLQSWSGTPHEMGAVVVRNYTTHDVNGPYTDSFASRLVRLAERPRYVGAIHEHWEWPCGESPTNVILRRTILRHDGYVEMNARSEAGRAKQARNIALLRKGLEHTPENLMIYLQMVESGRDEPDYLDILRQAVKLVEERKPYWEMLGPPILRYAVILAGMHNLPEHGEWIQKAEEWFPGSAFTQIDVAFHAFSYFLGLDEFEESARRGERYLKAMEEDRAGRLDKAARLRSVLQTDSPLQEQALKIALADVYRNLNRPEDARTLLLQVDFPVLDPGTTEKLARALMNLQMNTRADTAGLAAAAWDGISAPVPDEKAARKREDAFAGAALPAFLAESRQRELEKTDFFRHTYTLFLPLAGKCDLGTAAAILEAEDAGEARSLLTQVRRWDWLPAEALSHALELGTEFPLPERPLNLEEMDGLAAGLAQTPETLQPLLHDAAERAGSWQTLGWARALALAAVRTFEWESDNQEGTSLARLFAVVERAFLTGTYTQEVLQGENLRILPPMHRFGWYCAQAFQALKAGDAMGYVRLLRDGLESSPGMRDMVEYLTKYTPELQALKASAELTALAEKVKTMLAAWPPDAPEVAALKASPVYRKVAYLIEGETE